MKTKIYAAPAVKGLKVKIKIMAMRERQDNL